MRKPGRLLVTAITVPFMTGCFGVLPAPVPAPPEREGADIRGVVVRGDNGSDDVWVRFEEVLNVEWMDGGLEMIGLESASTPAVTRQYRYEDLSGVLKRQIDPTKTSILIGGVMVGALGILALVINGSGDRGSTVIIG